MGLMGRILGAGSAVKTVGEAVTGVAEVFVGNRAERDAAEHAQFTGALGQYGAEFAQTRSGWFDGAVNALNRLPRPMLALGTLGLFVYAMAEPGGFALRMQGLALVPEPLWWLLGAIVSFYFGARELHYRRENFLPPAKPGPTPTAPFAAPGTAARSLARPGALPLPELAPDTGCPAPAPGPAATAATPVVVRAADPHFNAAVEEWRRLRA